MGIERDPNSGLYNATIGEETYSFSKWGASESLKTLTKLARIVAEPLGIVLGNIAEEGKGGIKGLLDANFKPEMISGAIKSLMENLDEDTCLGLIKKFSSETVLCNGGKINFDMHYQDRFDVLFEVVKAGMEVQYGNFFGAFRDRVVAMVPVTKAKTISNKGHQMSTGTSGRRS